MCEDKFHTRLWNRLLKKGTVKQIAASLQLSSKQMYRWKEGDACYPLTALNKLCALAGMRPELAYIKTRYDSEKLFEPKVEQELNEEFSEFLGHLLHDGGIDKDWRVHYTSDEESLLNRFRQLVETCFGRDNNQIAAQWRRNNAILSRNNRSATQDEPGLAERQQGRV